MQTYALTLATEIVMLIWVWFGLRLRRIPFRSIFGNVSGSRTLGIDVLAAGAFWICSLSLLATINAALFITDALIHHRPLIQNGKLDPTQEKTIHTLTALAPSNMSVIAAWILLCVMAGITERGVDASAAICNGSSRRGDAARPPSASSSPRSCSAARTAIRAFTT